MSTPVNRYYLRSTEGEGSSEDPYESNLALSDHEDTFLSEGSVISETEVLNSTYPTVMASQIHMPYFHGNPGERATNWLKWFDNYCEVSNLPRDKRARLIPFYLRDHALAWLQMQSEEVTSDLDQLTAALKVRFNGSDGLDADMALFNLQQMPGETSASYFTRIYQVIANRQYPNSLLISLALKGLNNSVKMIVMPQNHKTLEDLRKACSLAEQTLAATTVPATTVPVAAAQSDNISDQLCAINKKLSELELQ